MQCSARKFAIPPIYEFSKAYKGQRQKFSQTKMEAL